MMRSPLGARRVAWLAGFAAGGDEVETGAWARRSSAEASAIEQRTKERDDRAIIGTAGLSHGGFAELVRSALRPPREHSFPDSPRRGESRAFAGNRCGPEHRAPPNVAR